MKKGSKMTLEQRKRVSEAHKGQTPWNKGKKGIYSKETQRKMDEGRKKAWSNPELRKRQSELTKKGMISLDVRKKISMAHKGKPSWNRGIKMPEFSGSKHPMFGKTHSERSKLKMSEASKKRMTNPSFRKRLSEIHKKRLSNPEEMKRQSDVSRKTILRLYESGSFPKQTNTKIERDIKEELVKRGYIEGRDFIHQFKFMNKFMCDFCFPLQKIIVEAYGDFWHCNPKKYPSGCKIHPHQIKGLKRDKAKEAYITKVDNHSWTYLILWESDIKENLAKCVDKIEEMLAIK